MKHHQFDPSILREYDIRGIVGETLSEADARALGQAFGAIVQQCGGQNVCVGRDGRLSSPSLEAALVEGLAASGVDVVRIGLGPTPMLYYAVHQMSAGGGIMVTGSHNPPDHNGFKMMVGQTAFFGDDIQALGRMVADAGISGPQDPVAEPGTVCEQNVQPAYMDRLLQGFDAGACNVAWDAGNGALGDVLTKVCARLPGRHDVLNGDIDGTFPNHHPDPTDPETLHQLRAHVLENKMDMGIAFDGDGDRIGAMDGSGEIIWGDQILSLLAAEVLREVPGSTIIADVKASQALFDTIAALGGDPLMWKTGHSLIKTKMAETGAPLAGEMSGHIFFKHGYYGFDDALYAALKLLEAVQRSGSSLEALRKGLPQLVNTPELRFPCDPARKFQVAGEIKARLADEATGADVNDIDGVRVTDEDGWWLVRASNTQDVLVARCEAYTHDGLARLKQTLVAQLRQSGVEPPKNL
jgi:phosphomannomutase